MFSFSHKNLLCADDVQFCENVSYFSKDISIVPLKGETSSKEEEQLWLGEKKICISGTENIKGNGESLVLDPLVEENGVFLVLDDLLVEENKIEHNCERLERLAHFFEEGYFRRKEHILVMPTFNPSTSLDDTIMLSDESSRIDTEVCTYSLESHEIPNPILILIITEDILYMIEQHLIDSIFQKSLILFIQPLTFYPITICLRLP